MDQLGSWANLNRIFKQIFNTAEHEAMQGITGKEEHAFITLESKESNNTICSGGKPREYKLPHG